MKMASTAADAAVDAQKISLKSRSQATWYTRAQKPEPNNNAATSQVLKRRTGQILPRTGVTPETLASGPSDADARHCVDAPGL